MGNFLSAIRSYWPTRQLGRGYLLLCVAPLVLVLLLPGRTLAQPKVACDSIPECDQRFDAARRLAQPGPSERSLQTFQKLYEDYPDPRLLYWIARHLDLLERPAEAVPTYQQFLSSDVERDPQIIAKARKQLVEAQGRLSSLPMPHVQNGVAPTANDAPENQPTPLQQKSDSGPGKNTGKDTKSQPTPATSIESSHASSRVAGRPTWRLITGGAAIGAGVLLVGFGASAFVSQGNCVEAAISPADVCDYVYSPLPAGAGLTAAGGALIVGGIVVMAWPKR